MVDTHAAAQVDCACTVCTGATVSTVVESAAHIAVLKELHVRVVHFVVRFTCMGLSPELD
ncbi:hypothetical protein GCM10007901_32490 [Dyella acidisoli]|uniref:Uncharacterized protein n=1 Tax=Dyella acidisoli TaxID=1867834 RepID=A0ABQ5XTK9_9GAMM|nr:hypothetical protein GCM10007901_32490 [Dyella acidisoli]